jgi:hypothetical protein
MNRSDLSLDVIQSAHSCMGFIDAELHDLPECERAHLVEILESFIAARRDHPTPRYTAQQEHGSRQTRLLLMRIQKRGRVC